MKHPFHKKDNNDVVLLCQPEVYQMQLLSTTANALSQRSCSLRLLESFVVREKTLHIYIYTHTHTIYTVLYAIFTISVHFLYFIHYSFREKFVSIAGQSSRLLLFNNFISWVIWLDFVWFCFICLGFLSSSLVPQSLPKASVSLL